MSSLITAEIKSKADELYHEDEICQQKTKQLFSEISLPNGLLPLKQKKSYTHKFEKIGKLVIYAPEVTAIVEKGKIKKLTGVKTKELLVWVQLSSIYVDDPQTGKVTFKTPNGPNTFTDSWINKFWPSSCVVDVVAPLNDPEVLFNSRSDSTQPAIRLLRNFPRFDQLKSKSTITGTISPNKLPSWTGVGVKVLFMWLDIVEIIRSGDNLTSNVLQNVVDAHVGMRWASTAERGRGSDFEFEDGHSENLGG
ncbi:hypothetical protein ACFX11_013277 [Malus domestica]